MLLIALSTFNTNAQTFDNWEDIIVTKNPNEVEGLERLGEVEAEAKKVFGKESKLRNSAMEKLKKEAALKGGSIVFLETDNFGNSPINNVTMRGTVYGSGSNKTISDKQQITPKKDSKVSNDINWEDIIVTKNSNEVKDLKRVGEVEAEAKKVFGKESKLRKSAMEKLKKEGALKGGTVIFLEVDNFGNSPINNVTMRGTVYK